MCRYIVENYYESNDTISDLITESISSLKKWFLVNPHSLTPREYVGHLTRLHISNIDTGWEITRKRPTFSQHRALNFSYGEHRGLHSLTLNMNNEYPLDIEQFMYDQKKLFARSDNYVSILDGFTTATTKNIQGTVYAIFTIIPTDIVYEYLSSGYSFSCLPYSSQGYEQKEFSTTLCQEETYTVLVDLSTYEHSVINMNKFSTPIVDSQMSMSQVRVTENDRRLHYNNTLRTITMDINAITGLKAMFAYFDGHTKVIEILTRYVNHEYSDEVTDFSSFSDILEKYGQLDMLDEIIEESGMPVELLTVYDIDSLVSVLHVVYATRSRLLEMSSKVTHMLNTMGHFEPIGLQNCTDYTIDLSRFMTVKETSMVSEEELSRFIKAYTEDNELWDEVIIPMLNDAEGIKQYFMRKIHETN